MIVGVPRESFPGERRVALVPAAIPNLTKAGLEVVVEASAGAGAGWPTLWFKFSVMDPTTRPAKPMFPFSAAARYSLDF